MDIWSWLHDSIRSHLDENDPSRLELYRLFRQSSGQRELNPEASFATLEEGRRRAAALKDGWWALFFEHWKLQNLLSSQRNYGAARDLAVRASLEARKPAYTALPQRVCLQEDLISSYVGIDARGHARLIEEALDYMAQEAAPDTECALCLLGLRSEFERERGDYGVAQDAATAYLAQSELKSNKHHALQAHLILCSLALWRPFAAEQVLDPNTLTPESEVVPVSEGLVSRQDFEARVRELDAHAVTAEELVQKVDATEYLPEIWMWRAHAALLLNEAENGQKFFKRAVDQFFSRGYFPSESFFLAWRMTYARLNNWEQGIRLIDDEAGWIDGHGQVAREARLARTRCHFKLAQGTLEAADLQAAREKIALLGTPEYEEQRLRDIETMWSNSNL